MSAPKPNPNADRPDEAAAAVDWAARLRASMNEQEAAPAPEASIPDEGDDLRQLLLAQLAGLGEASPANSPDTSEFEEEEEFFEEDEDDLSEEDEDDFSEEDEDDFSDEDEDDFSEEDEDDLSDEDEDDFSEEDEDDFSDEDEDDFSEEDEDDFSEEDEDDFSDEDEDDFSDEDEDDFSDEDADDLSEEANDTLTPSAASRGATDARLNGRVPYADGTHDDIGRRQALRDENARLLSVVGNAADEHQVPPTAASAPADRTARGTDAAPPADAASSAESADDASPEAPPSDAPPAAAQAPRPRPTAIVHDPLQVGYEPRKRRPTRASRMRVISAVLDEELPVETASPYVGRRRTYTEKMPGTSPVEVYGQDAALWDDLGYRAELPHAEDQRAAERGKQHLARTRDAAAGTASSEQDRHVTPTATAEDFHDRRESASDRARRRQVRHGRLVRLMAAVVGAVLMLGLDYLPTLSASPVEGSKLPFYATAAYPLLSLALLVVWAIPFATRLSRGLVGLIRFAPTRYSPAVLSLAAGLAYNGMALAVLTSKAVIMPLFGGLPLCTLALAALSEWLDAEGESEAFDLLSVGRSLWALTDEQTAAVTALDSRQYRTRTPLSAVPTTRIDRAYARMGRYNSHMAKLNFLLPAALGVAILSMGVYLFCEPDATLCDLLSVLALVYLSVLPSSYLVAMSLPLFRANRELSDSGSAVIGSAAPDTYAEDGEDERDICFADNDILMSTRCREIALREKRTDDPNALGTDHWRRLANRIFCLLGSPLAMEIPFEEEGTPENLAYMHIEILEREDNCLTFCLIDNTPGREETVEVMMGSHEALSAHGIRLPAKSGEREFCRSENSHVVYLAVSGQFRIGYAAEYRIRPDFETLARALADNQCKPVLVSYDPMLTSALLADPRFAALRTVEIVRPAIVDVPRRACSAGVVAMGDGQKLIHPLTACRRMKRCYRLSYLLSWVGMAATGALLLTCALLKSLTWISTFAVAGGQLLLCALTALITLSVIRRENLYLPPRETQKADRTLRKKPKSENPD